ncbi:MAG: hypothetical protein HY047_10005 [Acidobacteria bacterium]|nr:hypothetical protein [Acidobacteriota bacterium]
MAKRRPAKRAKPVRPARKKTRPARSARRRVAKRTTRRSLRPAKARATSPRLDRQRRTLDEVVPTPPSSLNMVRRGSAAGSGRADIEHRRHEHSGMPESITGGDVDVDVEDAYFTGDEAPGGDNPSPDLEVVDDIGRALGVQYDDNEELKSSDKIIERDRHRWEYDPASAEDYKERK